MTRKEVEDKLFNDMTDDFKRWVVEAGRLYGWDGDYIEIAKFISYILNISTTDVPSPYDFEGENCDGEMIL